MSYKFFFTLALVITLLENQQLNAKSQPHSNPIPEKQEGNVAKKLRAEVNKAQTTAPTTTRKSSGNRAQISQRPKPQLLNPTTMYEPNLKKSFHVNEIQSNISKMQETLNALKKSIQELETPN